MRPPQEGRRSRHFIAEQIEQDDSELRTFLSNDRRVNSLRAWCYALTLESCEVRTGRIIEILESTTVFGALFFCVIFNMWEYGSQTNTGNEIADRIFSFSCALCLVCSAFVSMFSCFTWICSLLFSGSSNKNWVFEARGMLALSMMLMSVIYGTTVVSFSLAIYAQMREHTPECIILLVFLFGVVGVCVHETCSLVAREAPLEFLNFPTLWRWIVMPFPAITRQGRDELEREAQLRAEVLREKMASQIQNEDEEVLQTASTQEELKGGSIEKLLLHATVNIGRNNVSIGLIRSYVKNLHHQWFDTLESLKELNAEQLSNYMPLRLAMEVRRIISNEDLSIICGSGDPAKKVN